MRLLTVVAGVIRRDGKVLICQRRPKDRHALEWEFPGGKVEPREGTHDALIRELREELAIEAQIEREICRYEFAYPGRKPITLIFYLVSEFAGEPENRIFQQILWEDPTRLQNYPFLEGDLHFVRALPRMLRDGDGLRC